MLVWYEMFSNEPFTRLTFEWARDQLAPITSLSFNRWPCADLFLPFPPCSSVSGIYSSRA